MKIALSTYSFSQYFNDGRLNQLACVKKAKDMGFDAIEFVDIIPHDGSSINDYAISLKNECEKYNLPISNYTVGADFLNGSGGIVEEEIKRLKGQIDIAEILGANSVRHDATIGFSNNMRKYRGFDNVLTILADACREITEYAAGKGIKTMVENHGFFCQDSERVEKLVNAVAHENFGLLTDMGNFMCADENPAAAMGKVATYAFYAHAKDFILKNGDGQNPGEGFFRSRNGNYLRGTIIGHGSVPVKHCLSALISSGYDGYIGLEFEGMEDAAEGIRIGLSNLRNYISQ